jgi:hypothetical protein
MAVTTTNSLVTNAEADTYFAGSLDSDAWDNNSAKRDKALITATRKMNALSFIGVKAVSTQPHEFPRTYWAAPSMDARDRTADSAQYTEDAIPQAIKDATCEWALFLLQQTAYEKARARQQAEGIIGMGTAGANEYSNAEQVTKGQWGDRIPPAVFRLVSPYLTTVVDLG